MKSWYWIISIVWILAILLFAYFDPAFYHYPRCPFRSLTGYLCPGCGSQRALHEVLHGRFLSAFRLNWLFIPGLLYALIGYILSLLFPNTWETVRKSWYGMNAGKISLVVILVFWVVRNLVNAPNLIH